MKHLFILYNFYFMLIMIVPCSHTIVYSKVLNSAFNLELANNEQHTKHTHNKKSPHSHYPCTPSCVCGITIFALITPPLNLFFIGSSSTLIQKVTCEGTNWAITDNQYNYLMSNNIWHPPKQA